MEINRNHIFLIESIFKTFFPGVEYVIESENSLEYLYNIRLTNSLGKTYNPMSFDPIYRFNSNTYYSENDFVLVFREFSSSLSGLILIYYQHLNDNQKTSIIVTPSQTKNRNYGIYAAITDPHKNRFGIH
jgi:hypothetical protein